MLLHARCLWQVLGSISQRLDLEALCSAHTRVCDLAPNQLAQFTDDRARVRLCYSLDVLRRMGLLEVVGAAPAAALADEDEHVGPEDRRPANMDALVGMFKVMGRGEIATLCGSLLFLGKRLLMTQDCCLSGLP